MPGMLSLTQVVLVLLASTSISSAGKTSNQLISLHEENWTEIMKGEWMVEFHAPWCPACKDLQKAWNAFADWSKDLNIKVGEVDVTVNPGLSGRFLVTALPTIYHVKDGVFRVYSGPRDKNDFITFIEDKRWRNIDPVPDYKHPNSKQMAVVAVFFKLSMAVRDLHNHLVEEKGVPSWASYSLFAGVTLALGCILGFFIVLIIDQVFPTGAKKAASPAKKDVKKDSNGSVKKSDESKKKDNSNSPKSSAETKKSKPWTLFVDVNVVYRELQSLLHTFHVNKH
ncbi:thioredoxin [Ancylostoma ceylanicum]|uniref:Thioredoxin-related transmembrane protein 1 n=2 Tax=Ancylostoma ceylanicum TaxID=53326 RepID=A0A0D6MD24_9BILA|nr:thioredoxin [Ancylostoma ceylanicum]